MGIEPGAQSLPARRAALIVLDGWGLAEPGPGNAMSQAHTPVFVSVVSAFKRFAAEVSFCRLSSHSYFVLLVWHLVFVPAMSITLTR